MCLAELSYWVKQQIEAKHENVFSMAKRVKKNFD